MSENSGFDPHLDDHAYDSSYGLMADYDPVVEPRAHCVPLPVGYRRDPGLPVPGPADYDAWEE